MYKYLVASVMVLSLVGCSTTTLRPEQVAANMVESAQLRIMIGHDFQDNEGTNPAAIIELRTVPTQGVFCSYVHKSNVFDGVPFNSRDETTMDIIGCGAEIDLFR